MEKYELEEGLTLFYQENKEGELEITGVEKEELKAFDGLRIPEKINGKYVTGLAPYAFRNMRWLRRIRLPEGIRRIGGHCFFDCRNLGKMELSDEVTEIGDGAFKNCESLAEISLIVKIRKSTCLKNILSECNQTMYVKLLYPDGQAASLVFPRYLLDFEANVEARIINQVTYGTGLEYRECFHYEDVDYKKYDDLFYMEQNVGEAEITARLAAARLVYPHLLSEKKEEEYFEFLLKDRKVFSRVFAWYTLHEEDAASFYRMLSEKEELFDLALTCAREQEQPQLVAALMETRHKQGRKKEEFIL